MANRLSFQNALSTLQSMFEEVDLEVIRMLLEANHGHMERTVENLLSIAGGQTEAVQENQNVHKNNADLDRNQNFFEKKTNQDSNRLANQFSVNRREVLTHTQSNAVALTRDLSFTDTLPEDFLRPPSWYKVDNSLY